MAKCLSSLHNKLLQSRLSSTVLRGNFFHTTSVNCEVQAAKTKISIMKDKPVTYERFYRPCDIAHRKSFNAWNNTTIEGGRRVSHTIFDDVFIRKFLMGTFHAMIFSEIIIKRQHNIIRIAFLLFPKISSVKLCFLIGYTEEMLGHILQGPVKLEIQSIKSAQDVVFKYI